MVCTGKFGEEGSRGRECARDCATQHVIAEARELRDRLAARQGQGRPEPCPPPPREDPCCEHLLAKGRRTQYKVTVDGQVVDILPDISRQPMVLYCPPCRVPRPPLDPSHACYGTKGDCCSSDLNAEGNKKYQLKRRVDSHFVQKCHNRNFHSVCTPWPCPKTHNHWYPHCTDCRYPNACWADCFLQPVFRDWLYRQPSYRFYLQRRDYKPF